MSPVPFGPPVALPRLLTANEVASLLRTTRKFLVLAGDAGLRCGEIIALEQTDVD